MVPQVGLCNLFVQHTSASLTINENASPDVPLDLNVRRLRPWVCAASLVGLEDDAQPVGVMTSLSRKTFSYERVSLHPYTGRELSYLGASA